MLFKFYPKLHLEHNKGNRILYTIFKLSSNNYLILFLTIEDLVIYSITNPPAKI